MIIPDREVQLDYRAFFVRVASQAQRVVAASEDGRLTVLDATLQAVVTRDLSHKICALAIHPSAELLAIVKDGGKTQLATDFNLNTVFETHSAVTSQEPQPRIGDGFSECYFAPTGELWSARHLRNGGVISIEVRDSISWDLVRSIELEDPFGSSAASFSAHPTSDVIVASLAAGQDGQQVFWLPTDDAQLHVVEVSTLKDTTPPTFHPAGHEFLIIEPTCKLRRMSFPDCTTLGICEWPYDEIEGEPGFDYDCCYLSDSVALVAANEGRLFLVDLDQMKITEELILQGHEPRVCEELYPRLKGDMQLISDLNFFHDVNSKYIVSVHQQLPNLVPDCWKDTVVQFGGDLFGSFCEIPSQNSHVDWLLSSAESRRRR